jgi:hypothetical protein
MNRRHLLAGLALASLRANPQTRTPDAPGPSESLYIPKPQLVEDRRFFTISWRNSRSSIW